MSSIRASASAVLVLASLVSAQAGLAQELELAPLRLGFPLDRWADERDIALADWDGDGDLDALRTRRSLGDGELALLINDGHARFERGPAVPLPGIQLALGDLEGDGAIDAVVATRYGAFRTRREGRGGLAVFPLGIDDPRHLALGDLDGDGDLDVAACRFDSWSYRLDLVWSRNQGAAGFEAPVELAVDVGGEIAVADLDGDADLDLAVPVAAGILVLFGDGSGGFAEQVVLARPSAYPGYALAAGDVDGNGAVDLLLAVDQPTLFLNLGARTFVDASERIPALESALGMTLVDVDRDGDLDLLAGPHLQLNDGTGDFHGAASGYPAHPSDSFTAGDVDGDADIDLVLARPNELLLGDGTGAFHVAGAELPALDGWSFGPAALGDLDGDGDLDVVAGTMTASPPVLSSFFNDGRGVLTPVALPPGLDVPWGERARLGDLDEDGDLDLLLPFAGAIGVNDGSGSFSARACPPVSGSVQDVTLGDLDGDGDLDAYLARAQEMGCHFPPCYRSVPDGLLIQDDSGCLVGDSAGLAAVFDVALGASLGDFDRDGDLDVVTSAGRGLRNDGAGGLTDEPWFAAGAYLGFDVDVGDVELDGDLDVLFGAALARNVGDGSAYAFESLPRAGRYAGFADLDVDGDLDVALSVIPSDESSPPELVLLRNDAETFAVFPQPQAYGAGPLALGDLDHDGDPDLITNGLVLFDLRRSLASRGEARLGQPLSLALAGSPLAPYALIGATALAASPTPLGLRQLDLGASVYRKPGRFDAAGRDERAFSVPRDPVLLGATLHWQALIGAPLRWSNRESTTLVGF